MKNKVKFFILVVLVSSSIVYFLDSLVSHAHGNWLLFTLAVIDIFGVAVLYYLYSDLKEEKKRLYSDNIVIKFDRTEYTVLCSLLESKIDKYRLDNYVAATIQRDLLSDSSNEDSVKRFYSKVSVDD